MKKQLLILSILLIANICCVSTRNNDNDSSKQSINNKNDSTSILTFEANVDKIELKPLPDELLFGIKYKKEIINKLSDSCELIQKT